MSDTAQRATMLTAIKTWPVKSPALRLALVREDRCPECGGELDTGRECMTCDFDALPIAEKLGYEVDQ